MKTRNLTRWSFVIIAMFLMSFYVESYYTLSVRETSIDLASTAKKKAARLGHARELLGSGYKGSLAEQSSTMPSISEFVHKTMATKLGKNWKKQADKVSEMILAESEKKGFDPIFVLAVIQTESQFDPTIVGTAGEIGLMQIKPDTAKWISQKENIPWKGKATLKNPVMNVKIGIAYMSFLRKNFAGAANRYVAAYNMGPKNVRRLVAQSVQPKDYATRVMANYTTIYSEMLKIDSLAQL